MTPGSTLLHTPDMAQRQQRPKKHDRVGPRRSRSPFATYMMLEAPGWVLAGVVLGFFVQTEDLTLRVAVLLFALWVIKDFVLYPILRVAYVESSPDGTEGLVGALGTARERLDPEGYVRVGSELWRAVLTRDAAPVEAGASVRVLAVRNLTLQVEPA